MKPLDFLWSEQPVFSLSEEQEDQAVASVEAAEQASYAVATCVRDGVGDGDAKSGAGQRAREAFFSETQGAFEEMLESMSAGRPFAAREWVESMRGAALPIFDREVVPGLADLGETRRQKAIKARSKLITAFAGWPPLGKKIFDPLGLKRPAKQARQRGHG